MQSLYFGFYIKFDISRSPHCVKKYFDSYIVYDQKVGCSATEIIGQNFFCYFPACTRYTTDLHFTFVLILKKVKNRLSFKKPDVFIRRKGTAARHLVLPLLEFFPALGSPEELLLPLPLCHLLQPLSVLLVTWPHAHILQGS